MRLTSSTKLRPHARKGRAWLALAAAALAAAGCSKSTDLAQVDQAAQDQYKARIKAIQDNPGMPAEAKQRAIAMIKSQQAATGKAETHP